jgi:anti-sigma factor RsiW
MCDYSGKLLAWLDGELENDDMASVQRHIEECIECQGRINCLKQVSRAFEVYCDAVVSAKVPARVPRWVPVASVAAVATIAAALLLIFLRPRVEPVGLPPSVKVAPPTVVLETKAPTPAKAVHRRRVAPVRQVQSQNANWSALPGEPAIQIAIPAESMFPPGAFPEGVTFIADLNLAPDGSAQQIRLRPRLIGFERRTTQP